MTLPIKQKVMAYITHGTRLLVFRQPDFPDAGIQVPGGSVGPNEPLDLAVMREAREETGLDGLRLEAFLGDTRHDFSPRGRFEIHHRHYYHHTVSEDVPETWRHHETNPSEGVYDSILFELLWVQLLDGVPRLISDMDEMLPQLVSRMGVE
jgi:8-oxo-dGTP pyrophosphatase MutT (NUDIX family)